MKYAENDLHPRVTENFTEISWSLSVVYTSENCNISFIILLLFVWQAWAMRYNL